MMVVHAYNCVLSFHDLENGVKAFRSKNWHKV